VYSGVTLNGKNVLVRHRRMHGHAFTTLVKFDELKQRLTSGVAKK